MYIVYNHNINTRNVYTVNMEQQLTKIVSVRVTEDEYALLCRYATEDDRSLSYVAREKLKKGLAC